MTQLVKMKVVLVGDSAVGKTCIINSLLGNKFDNYKPTINASNFDVNIKVESQEVKLSIWDTAGQETYQSLAPIYSRESKAQILVFAIDNETSFGNLSGWHECISDSLNCVFVVANKIDLPESERQVTFDEGLEFAHSINATYCEVSAKDGIGINELFNQVAQQVSASNKEEKKEVVTVKLDENSKSSTRRKRGC